MEMIEWKVLDKDSKLPIDGSAFFCLWRSNTKIIEDKIEIMVFSNDGKYQWFVSRYNSYDYDELLKLFSHWAFINLPENE